MSTRNEAVFDETCTASDRRLMTRLGSRVNRKVGPKLKTILKAKARFTHVSEKDTGYYDQQP